MTPKHTILLTAGFVAFSQVLTGGCGSPDSPGAGVPNSAAARAFPVGLSLESPAAAKARSGLSLLTSRFQQSGESVSPESLYPLLQGKKAEDCRVSLPEIRTLQLPSCFGKEIQSANEGSQACASATLNAQLRNVGEKLDQALVLTGTMSCLLNAGDSQLPGTGVSIDLTSSLNTALQVKNPTVTISGATIRRMPDDRGFPVYLYSITAQLTQGSAPIIATIQMKHSPTSNDQTSYRGKVWSYLSNLPGLPPGFAYSVSYEKIATQFNYRVLSADYGYRPATVFDPSGNVALSGAWTGNFGHAIVNTDSSAGSSNVSYAWQGTIQDMVSNVFHLYTRKQGSGARGCAFFGHGAAFVATSGNVGDNSIQGYVCGKKGELRNLESTAQKQCMEQGYSGAFTPVVESASSGIEDCGPMNGAGLVNFSSDTDYDEFSQPVLPTEI